MKVRLDIRRIAPAAGRFAAACAVLFLLAAQAAFAQDPEPPIENRWEVDLGVGALPFNPGQTFSYVVPNSIPDSASQVLVVTTFTCSLIQGQIQGGMLIQWTIWSPILLGNGTPSTASFQQLLWCAPGQLTTVQSIQWLPITAASRVLFGRLDTTGNIPWDKTESTVKIVSYQ
jgi:hypothetical protein